MDREYITDHVFSIILDCPVSLLGRDLFIKLDLQVSAKNQGRRVHSDLIPVSTPVPLILANIQNHPELNNINPA